MFCSKIVGIPLYSVIIEEEIRCVSNECFKPICARFGVWQRCLFCPESPVGVIIRTRITLSLMKVPLKFTAFAAVLTLLLLGPTISAFAQQERYNGAKSQETSDADGVPVLLKHLPDWENVKGSAVFITDANGLNAAVGRRTISDLVDFAGGTEAVSAKYASGTVLIIEYTNPQLSIAADKNFMPRVAEDPSIVYRRIGNYSAFVFDAQDQAAAHSLLDQIRYEKQVQWLGEDPFLLQKIERYFAQTGRDVAISTVIWIVMIFGITIATGIAVGIFYFRYRESQRTGMTAFSDAGGLTRLNLDDLSEPIIK